MSIQIAVTGRAEVRIAPELGAVAVSVTSSGADRSRALRDVAEAHERLLADVRSLEAEGVLESWSAGQLRAWASRPWSADGTQLALVHTARTEVEVIFRDLDRLAEWAGETGFGELVAIGGVDWRLTDATNRRVREEAQRGAVADAVAKADVYADALGVGRPTPVELADSGLLAVQPGGGGPQPVLFARTARFSAADASGSPELAPAELVIEASVDARFAAEPRA